MTDFIDAAPQGYADVNRTLSLAFHTDPALSYILSDDALRRQRLPRLFDLLVEDDIRSGRAVHSTGHEAAALWRAPGKAG